MRKTLIILIALFILAVVAFSIQRIIQVKQNVDVVCTEDAKICPDGSTVGRIPPACEFAPCGGSLVSATPVSAKTDEVLLYYYNPEKDKDAQGNIKCSRDGLTAVKRQIPHSQTPVKETINLHLKGKENLNQADLALGIITEYPLPGLTLSDANLKSDGSLLLTFSDPQNKTGGGSCRVGILWFQIEATAKQFPQVKSVSFLPEELFQP